MTDVREKIRVRMDNAISQGLLEGNQYTASQHCADVAMDFALKFATSHTKAVKRAALRLLEKHGDTPEGKRLQRAVTRQEDPNE